MSTPKATAILSGAAELVRALKLAVPATKARVVEVVHHHTVSVTGKAKAAAPRVTGELASTIRDEYTQDGLTGFVKVGYGKLPRRSKAQTIAGQARAKVRVRRTGLGAYAPVVERGDPRRHHLPHPFVNPAYQAEKPEIVKDLNTALERSMTDIGNATP